MLSIPNLLGDQAETNIHPEAFSIDLEKEDRESEIE
jgi:hypothetical protein